MRITYKKIDCKTRSRLYILLLVLLSLIVFASVLTDEYSFINKYSAKTPVSAICETGVYIVGFCNDVKRTTASKTVTLLIKQFVGKILRCLQQLLVVADYGITLYKRFRSAGTDDKLAAVIEGVSKNVGLRQLVFRLG